MARYAFYCFAQELPELVAAVYQLDARLRRDARPGAADILIRAYGELMLDLERLGRAVATVATDELKASERRTRVRPDSGGGGGPRLEDSLIAEPLTSLPGSVGVANEDTLDANVPWWSTNEEGSHARVGGRLFGLFFGGQQSDAPPDPGMFREHPLFQPAGPESGAGLGIIQNPIPERRFIEKALPVISREWHSAFDAAKRKFDAQLGIALATRR